MELLSLQAVWAVIAIVLIDIVLAGDNALVIGMAANRLSPDLRRKTIFWGTFGAIAVRFLSVALLTWLLLIPGLRLIGGLALIYIGWRLAVQRPDHAIDAKDTFWKAIGTIVVADAVMGVDNALGIAAAAGGDFYLVIFGLLVSVPIILFGSTMVSRLLTSYPDSVFLGSFVLFVVALQMIMKEQAVSDYLAPLDAWVRQGTPWVVALILTARQYYRMRIKVR